MAKIPLRVYNKEIDQMVENGQTAEAVAHCKHILKLFPKHIDTYRLLGQAYLTEQRYTEAADILQRVLSVVPDDFISQIGMSIIREDEGNLDAAIYHMEKAFEVQPAKSAIQGELRRLYGRRDGMEPPKIRLTRGALVRMYMRGELYPQAIAEVRSALADDAQQLDLEVILARLYALSGQKVQAVEICNRLVAKLPFCLEANRILAEVLPGTTRADDAKVFRDRVQALDPYTGFLNEKNNDPASVPDAAVQLERLEYNAAADVSEQPEWTRTAGVAWDEGGQAEVPAWLQEAPADTAPVEPVQAVEFEAEAEMESAAPADIPEWMAAAGWAPSTGEAEEGPMPVIEEEEPISEDTLAAPGQIPDWLQSLAPETPVVEPETTAEEDEAWLQKIVGEGTTTVPEIQPAEPALTPVDAGTAEELPDWLQEMKAGEPAAAGATAEAEERLPDWLQEMEAGEADAGQETALEAAEELPDWLQEMRTAEAPVTADAGTIETTAETGEEIPDWLQEMEAGETVAGQEAAEDLPDWLQVMKAGEVAAAEVEEMETVAETTEQLPDWLQEMKAEVPAAAEVEGMETVAETTEELPDWLQEMKAEESAAVIETSAEAVEELPDWMSQQIETGAEITQEAVADGLPALQDAPAGESQVDFEASGENIIIDEGEIPEVAQAGEAVLPDTLPEEASAVMVILPDAPVEAVSPVEPTLSPDADLDSALAWLEALAAKQGVDESELLTQPEQRVQDTPDWITRAVEETPEEVIEFAAQPAEDAVDLPGAMVFTPEAEMETGLPKPEIEQAETDQPAEMFPVEALDAEQPVFETEISPLEELDTIGEAEALPAEAVAEELSVAEEITLPAGALDFPIGEMDAQVETPTEEVVMKEPEWIEPAVDVNAPTQPVRVAPVEAVAEISPVVEETQPVEAPEAQVEAPVVQEIELTEPVDAMPEAVAEQPEAIEMEPEVAAELLEGIETLPAAAVEPPVAQAGMPDDIDSALAWLEALAARQGAEEGTLLTAPESRLETPPEWVEAVTAQQEMQLAQEPSEPVLEQIEMDEAVDETTPVAEEISESITEVMEKDEVTSQLPAEPVAQGWVLEADTAETAGKDEIPEWLQDLEFADTAQEEGAQPAEALPAWLQDLENEPEEPVSAVMGVGEWATEDAVDALLPESVDMAAEMPEEINTQSVEENLETAIPVEERTQPVPVVTEKPVVAEGVEVVDAPVAEKSNQLEEARRALEHGEIDTALACYASLTGSGEQLEDIIHDLRDATYRFPMNTDIWQALGDAYRQGNHIQDALDAYTKAIELLR